jgi:phosphoglycerate dehydrogenase-like enzyme
MDVTSPEPLPDKHPLFAHERAIVTPHLSGDVENEMDEVVRMCVAGVQRWRKGKGLWGVVDAEKGY